MPVRVEQRGGLLVAIETSTGRIVNRIEIRDGIMYFLADDGVVLENKIIGTTRRIVYTACDAHCEAENLTGDRPDCHKRHPAAEWKES